MADETTAARAPSGTHDVLWPESTRWEALVATLRRPRSSAAGYGLAHTPIFEDVRVFRRGIGEGSDVVGKEMYEFEDRGGRTLALRPEGTAPMVRAFVQHRPPLPWKAWYATPAFRYERPQAGRYRQHHQLGVEALGTRRPRPRRRGGLPGRRVLPLARAWPHFELRLNSMGDGVCRPGLPRAPARRTWPSAATSCAPSTSERLEANPLRVLDCKREECRAATADAPRLVDHLCDPCREHFDRVRAGLAALGVPYVLDHRLVRGFDYYTRTTFEFASEALECGPERHRRRRPLRRPGGDAGRPAHAGDRLRDRHRAAAAGLRRRGGVPGVARRPSTPSWSTWPAGESARDLTAELRRAGLRADRAFDGRSMKSQLKSADRSGARVALIVGPDEVAAGTVSVRPLRGRRTQRTVSARRGGRRCACAAQPSEARPVERARRRLTDRSARPGTRGAHLGTRAPERTQRDRHPSGRRTERHVDAHPSVRAARDGRRRRRTVTVCGWVAKRREHGEHLAFVDLRDHTGIVQCVIPGTVDVRSEYVVAVEGVVRHRPEGTVNPDLPTGEVELGDCIVDGAQPPPSRRPSRSTTGWRWTRSSG